VARCGGGGVLLRELFEASAFDDGYGRIAAGSLIIPQTILGPTA
jgi:hypothetical protein